MADPAARHPGEPDVAMDPLPAAVEAGLERARSLGFFGPGPIEDQLAVAARFAAAAAALDGVAHALDLGSGGGLPGLALAVWMPGTTWTLLDAMERRTAVVAQVVADAGLEGRVAVLTARAEDAGRDPRRRGSVDLVVSRSFGPPAVVAECASPFLRAGGHLLVSEPPGGGPSPDETRWPPGPLAELGLRSVRTHGGIHVMAKVGAAPDSVPRRSGMPKKRPLWP